MARVNKSVLRVLDGESVWPPPVWMMRQAGRYLPEYLETRRQAGSFLALCQNPALAAEVTLQPIRRFGFDAAILFSDILVVPHALGCEFTLNEGEGPRLSPAVTTRAEFDRLESNLRLDRLEFVFETLGRVRRELPEETTLLGFCGAPWTVATYMIAGRGTPDQEPALSLARRDADLMGRIIDLLVEASIIYLAQQIEAGADAVQLFESHAGALPDELLGPLSIEPMGRIAAGVRARHPHAKIIVFARGAGEGLSSLVQAGYADALGLDQDFPLDRALALLPVGCPSQGNLDPLLLIEGGEALDRGVDAILERVKGRPHIFNLGHGITPPTPVENVRRMLDRIRRA